MRLRDEIADLRALYEAKADPALVTDVRVAVESETDPETGLVAQYFGAHGKYGERPFYARRGKTKYGQPTWRFYKEGTWDRESFPKKVRRAIGEVLKAKLAVMLAARKS